MSSLSSSSSFSESRGVGNRNAVPTVVESSALAIRPPLPPVRFSVFCESCLFRGLSEIANACIGRRARIRSYWSSFRGIPTSRKKCVPSIAFQCLTVIDLLSGAVERREASAFDDEEACRSQDRLAATDASGTSAQSRRASMRVHVRPAPVVEASPCPSLFRRTSHPRSDTRRLQHRARIGRQGRNELCVPGVQRVPKSDTRYGLRTIKIPIYMKGKYMVAKYIAAFLRSRTLLNICAFITF